jgi:hypothetical protein
MKKTRKNQKSIDIELMGYRACYKNGKRVPCSKIKNSYKKKTVVKKTNTYKNNNNILNFGCSKNGKKVPCNKLKFF